MSFSWFIVGAGSLPIQCAEILLQRGHRICGVVSDDEQLTRWAQERGIAHAPPGENLASFLSRQPFDYLLSVVNEHILSKEVLRLPRVCAINYHDAPLPRYAGTHATSWALMQRERFHGITWHVIAETVDAVDILKQRIIDIAHGETAVTLNAKCYEAAIASFAELVDDLARGQVNPTKQRLEERTFYPRYKRPAAACVFSWDGDAEDIDALIRALEFGTYPNPLGLAKFRVGDDFIVVRRAEVTAVRSAAPAGTITAIHADALTVATGTRDIALRRLQTVDGRDLAIPEFVERFGLSEGYRLEALGAQDAERATTLNGAICRHETFWVNRLASLAPVELPYRIRGGTACADAHRQASASVAVPDELEALLRSGSTTWARRDVLLAGFTALLARIGGMDSFDIGYSDATLRAETAGLERLFASTVPLRIDVSLGESFAAHVASVRERLEEVRRRGTYLRDIVSRYPRLRAVSRSLALTLPVSVEVVARWSDHVTASRGELALIIAEEERECRCVYDPDAVPEEEARRLLERLTTLLEGAAASPDRPVGELPILSDVEWHRLVYEWNATQAEYPREATLVQLFEAQVRRCPDAVAVRAKDGSLTYRELNARANQLARHLQQQGVGRESLVGVCLERTCELLVSLLGILKSGAAYVPLDPDYPRERLRFMAADAGLSALVTQRKLRELVAVGSATAVVLVDEQAGQIRQQAEHDLPAQAGAQDLVYVLYTSGSTGTPKGVEVLHGALVNYLWAMRQRPGYEPQDVLLAMSSLSFDIAGTELYLPLICGGRVELVTRDIATDGRRLRQYIESESVTMLQATPATMWMLLEAGWRGDGRLKALCGGEPMPVDLVRQLLERCGSLWNMYGPTEATVACSCDRIESASEPITIGRPMANVEFYILDQRCQPVPVGVNGELYIGGAGLARGYRGRPELTAEKFVPHPFKPGERLYRTGDLARWRADGRVEYVGRLDHQVKIRGYRIELGEIETTLLTHPTVSQAVVIAREDIPGDKVLVGYVVTADGRRIDAGELRRHLQRTLPDYMVPQYFVTLERFPLTPNGKIDRARLPAPERRAESAERYVEPRNPTEQRLARIWAEVLGLERLGVHDDFFDLGGHSLKAVRMLSAVAEAFKVELPLQTLFQASTIAGLAEKLDEALGTRSTGNSGDTVDGERSEPRTATERRLLVIWERLLDTRPIGVRDDFFALQGDRDLLERMLAQVRAEFGVFAEGIPLPAFRNNPTIEGLARIIDNGIAPPESLLVCLQARGSRRPLFLIHAGGGYVFFYRALAERLGPDRPVYAIRAETKADGLGHPFEKSRSIEELAARYIAEIRKVQPRGPYSLGGACLGGVIAFEMARQLCAQGEEISGPVLLFDAFVFNNPFAGMTRPGASSQSQAAYLKGRIGHHLRSVTGLGMEAAARYLLRKIRDNLTDILRVVPNSIEVLLRRIQRRYADLRKELKWRLAELRGPRMPLEERQRLTMERYLKVSERLLARYRPGVYEGCIVVFKAVEGPDSEPHWTGLARGGMVCHAMAGTHLDMMEEPAVAVTAALVAGHLDEAPSAQPLSSRSDGDGVAAEDEPVAADVSRSAVG